MTEDIAKQIEAFPGLVVRGRKVPYVLFARKYKTKDVASGVEKEVSDLWPLNLSGHQDAFIVYQYASKGFRPVKFWLPERTPEQMRWPWAEIQEALAGVMGQTDSRVKELEEHNAALEAKIKEYEQSKQERNIRPVK